MDKKYLTVAQVADLAGVSKQAVYQRMNKDLNKFIKEIDGKKMLDSSVIEEFEPKKVEQEVEQVEQEVEQALASTLKALTATIEMLQKQLEVKDAQIQELNKLLEQSLNNQSQDNYIMAQQAKLLSEATEEKNTNSQEISIPEKKSFWAKFSRK